MTTNVKEVEFRRHILPAQAYKYWPLVPLFISCGFFGIGCRCMGLIMALYSGWIVANRIANKILPTN